MRIDVAFTPAEIATTDIGERIIVVVDVLRATSSIVEALANGARAVSPASGIDEAVRVAQNIGRDQVVLCGERRTLPIEGFDLGNSPGEFTAERVAGKFLVMTTTNGTSAVLAAAHARRVLIGSLLNLGAVTAALDADGGPVTVACAGREKRFALEDAVCAGLIVERLTGRSGEMADSLAPAGDGECSDAALAARSLSMRYADDLAALLRGTAAGRQLIEAGLEDDIDACARLDRHAVVPELHDRQITL